MERQKEKAPFAQIIKPLITNLLHLIIDAFSVWTDLNLNVNASKQASFG